MWASMPTLSASRRPAVRRAVFLIDTNVISQLRKGSRANPGVLRFFEVQAACTGGGDGVTAGFRLIGAAGSPASGLRFKLKSLLF